MKDSEICPLITGDGRMVGKAVPDRYALDMYFVLNNYNVDTI